MSGLKVNCVSYLLIVALGVIFSVYVMVSAEMSIMALADFLMVFGNTYGLLLVIALLGNGLVEVPRAIWRCRDSDMELQRLMLKAVLIDTEVYDSQCELDDAETAVHKMSRRVFAKPLDCSALTKHMDRINEACEAALGTSDGASDPLTALPASDVASGRRTGPTSRQIRGGRVRDEELKKDDYDDAPSRDSLARLAKRLRVAQERVHASQQRWQSLLRDYNRASAESDRGDAGIVVKTGVGGGVAGLEDARAGGSKRVLASLRTLWARTGLARPCLGVVAGSCACLSAVVVWSELAMGLPVSMSPWGLLISNIADDGSAYPAAIQLVALVPYAYMSICTFYSLFKLKLFGLLTLHGPHQSTPGPLIFNAIYLIRLQFPLGYNYLLTLSPPNARGRAAISSDVAFKQLMTSMETVPLFGQGFVVYAPIVLAVLCAFTLFNCHARILRFVGIEHEDSFLLVDEEDETQERLREGSMILDQATRRKRGDNRSQRISKRGSSLREGPGADSELSGRVRAQAHVISEVTSPFMAGP